MSVCAITAAGAGALSFGIAQAPVQLAAAAAGINDFYILAGATKPFWGGPPTFTIPQNFASFATDSGVFPSGGGGGSIGAPGGGNGNGRSTPLLR